MDGATSITPRSHAQPLFHHIAVATQTAVGEAYFVAVTSTIREAWNVAGAFVTKADAGDASRGRVVAIDSSLDAVGIGAEVRGAPWLAESGGQTTYHSDCSTMFSDDPILASLEARTYMAVPLTSADGLTIGSVGLIDTRRWPPDEATAAEALLRLIAPRASAELERLQIASEARTFRALADAGGDAVVRWAMAGVPRVLYANEAFERLSGYTAAELRSDATAILEPIIAAGNEAPMDSEPGARLTRKDGSQVDVTFRLHPAPEAAHVAAEYACVVRPFHPISNSALPSEAGALTQVVLDALEFPVAIVRDDAVVYMNRRAEAVTGATSDELLALRIVVQRSGADLSLSVRDWLKQLPRTKNAKTMIRLRPRRGNVRLLEVRSRGLNVSGSPVVVLTATDVTEQRRHEDGLTERAALTRTILDSMALGILVLDRHGTVIWANDQWNERGRAADGHPCVRPAVIGDRFTDFLREMSGSGEAAAHKAAVAIGSVLSESVPYAVAPHDAADADGAAQSFMLVITPLVNGAGVVVRHIESTILTRQMRALGDRESRARALLDNLPDQVARVSRDGEIVEVLGPTARAPVVAPLTRGSFRTTLRDVLPERQAESLLRAIHEATQANTLMFANFRLPYEDSERQYEARIVPLDDSRDVLLVLRDRSAEQWAPSMAEGSENGSRRPKVIQENLYGLTFREVAVLELMAHGASDKEIASRLGVSVFTVNKHVSRILHKMGAGSRTEASIRTLREGLFVS